MNIFWSPTGPDGCGAHGDAAAGNAEGPGVVAGAFGESSDGQTVTPWARR